MSPLYAVQASNSRGDRAVATSALFLAIAGLFVTARCITRFGLVRTCGADDVLIICSLALSIAFTGVIHARKYVFISH